MKSASGPDVCLLLDEQDARRGRRFWSRADLVVEVVSADNPARDYWRNRQDYAAAGIPEYWVVDPQSQQITVFALRETAYVEHGVFKSGQTIDSPSVSGLTLNVGECFAAGAKAATNDEPRA